MSLSSIRVLNLSHYDETRHIMIASLLSHFLGRSVTLRVVFRTKVRTSVRLQREIILKDICFS